MEQLGIEPSLLLAQIVNFSIIIFVLTKLLYKPILAMLEKRKKEIEAGLALTESMRQEEEKLSVKQEKLLAVARKDAREIVEKAKKDAGELEKQIVQEAHEQAAGIIEKGRQDVEAMREEMIAGVRKDAVELGVAMAKQLTKSVLDEKAQHTLVGQHLKSLSAVHV